MLPSIRESARPEEAGIVPEDILQAAPPTFGRRRKRFPLAAGLAITWLAVIAICAATAQWLPIQNPLALDLYHVESGPTSAHWLGTDSLGRDILARLIYGAQTDAIVALGTLAIGCCIGCFLGVSGGYFRGVTDWVIVRVLDILLAFPGLVLILALATFLGPSLRNVTLVIGVFVIPGFARMARATTMQLSQREFVLAARALGATDFRILTREVLPGVMLPVLTLAMLVTGSAIIVEGALSFLGAGIPPPNASWGSMIAGGLSDLAYDPLPVLIPSAVLCVTVLALNYLAERLRGAVLVRTSVI
jgi:peptide/nickel transport system permease protein